MTIMNTVNGLTSCRLLCGFTGHGGELVRGLFCLRGLDLGYHQGYHQTLCEYHFDSSNYLQRRNREGQSQ